jgi:hypothetical protein
VGDPTSNPAGGSQSSSRRGYLQVDAINPLDGSRFQVLISESRLRLIAARSKGQILEVRDLVPLALQHPMSIFEGLCTDADEPVGRGVGWRCYCTVPTKSFARDGREINPYPRQVFLVFVNDEKVAYNWYWTESDPADPTLPFRWEQRFKARVL